RSKPRLSRNKSLRDWVIRLVNGSPCSLPRGRPGKRTTSPRLATSPHERRRCSQVYSKNSAPIITKPTSLDQTFSSIVINSTSSSLKNLNLKPQRRNSHVRKR